LAGYKRPRSIDFIGELPKNAAGKIDKAQLKRIYKEKFKKEREVPKVKD
jgi:acyl-CoA synthetase (AMP-forming)/AMP-acid ligase II